MLEPITTKITKLEDKTLNEIMNKIQTGEEVTKEEQDILFKGLLK